MGIIVSELLTICRGLSREELTELVIEMKPLVDGLMEDSAANDDSSGALKKGGGMPFWVKAVTGFDGSQKGMFQVQGDFVRPSKLGDLADGTLLLVGSKVAKGAYRLLKARRGCEYRFDLEGTNDRSVRVELKQAFAYSSDTDKEDILKAIESIYYQPF